MIDCTSQEDSGRWFSSATGKGECAASFYEFFFGGSFYPESFYKRCPDLAPALSPTFPHPCPLRAASWIGASPLLFTQGSPLCPLERLRMCGDGIHTTRARGFRRLAAARRTGCLKWPKKRSCAPWTWKNRVTGVGGVEQACKGLLRAQQGLESHSSRHPRLSRQTVGRRV